MHHTYSASTSATIITTSTTAIALRKLLLYLNFCFSSSLRWSLLLGTIPRSMLLYLDHWGLSLITAPVPRTLILYLDHCNCIWCTTLLQYLHQHYLSHLDPCNCTSKTATVPQHLLFIEFASSTATLCRSLLITATIPRSLLLYLDHWYLSLITATVLRALILYLDHCYFVKLLLVCTELLLATRLQYYLTYYHTVTVLLMVIWRR